MVPLGSEIPKEAPMTFEKVNEGDDAEDRDEMISQLFGEYTT
jgi:hypothetical protein